MFLFILGETEGRIATPGTSVRQGYYRVWHFARAGSQKLSGQAAAGPGPLEVIAAAIAVYVQQLAAGVKARHQPALQGAGIKFRGVQPAGSDLGLVKAAGAGDGKGKMGGLPCNAPQVVPSEYRPPFDW